ncbi:MAG: hypothetical protein A3F67_10070 [Verrucomicrobia bacterium RIFCSPHIGHO2_12_FULL_41_10]|nr:MAG: hypothetical protein A3F67_10070 [Verrucomicrobia bacterium RIFCSPHIGHO2_12_FULL_41_10]HLB34203.1 shikimate kinase [Chthoniobacterales bacterium]
MKLDNIILIGFMGSGKSSIGKRLAKELKYDYLDSDELVTQKSNMSVTEIFETQGENAFRELESEALENLLGKEKVVLATGGGAILRSKNQETLRSLGTIVWLHASTDVLFERARRNPYRPLLEVEHPRHTFNQLLASRLPFYEAASDCQVDTTHLFYHQTIGAIRIAISDYLAYRPNSH